LGRVLSFSEDDEGVWVGGDGGAARIGPRGVLRLSRRNGFVGSVKSIITDRHGALWIGAGSGLSRVDRKELEAVAAMPDHQVRRRYYTAADGMAGVPYSEGSATVARASDGRLWFVTTTGVTVVNPDHISEPSASLSPKVEALTTDSIAQPVVQQVELPSRTAHMQIAFGAAAVRDPSRVGFRYQLEGFDRDWVDAGQSRLASYTHLPPRDYRFRVAVTNGDGVWSEQEAVLALTVEPAFVQTRWFYALMIGATALLVLAAWRLHVRQVRREFAMVLAERVRLGRALHDTLLQGLASMALQVDDVAYHVDGAPGTAKERLRYIRWQVEDHIRRARHEIWELRSPILESHDLLRALRRAAEEAAASRPVELTVSSTGAPRLGTAAVVENLVFIGQEAVSNAVRHGHASRVTVSLDYEADAMRLTVSDDGGGFDPETARPGHYGLVGMRERAEHLRGHLAIQSAPGRGTRVEASVPV
jgi:signal transduction histidine kinase